MKKQNEKKKQDDENKKNYYEELNRKFNNKTKQIIKPKETIYQLHNQH